MKYVKLFPVTEIGMGRGEGEPLGVKGTDAPATLQGTTGMKREAMPNGREDA